MANLLSVKQFAAISLGQATGLWHLGALCPLYNQKSISLKASIASLSATKTIVFVNMALTTGMLEDVDLDGVYTIAAASAEYLQGSWYVGNSKEGLTALMATLEPIGASIVYLSSTPNNVGKWACIGISATFAGLASLVVNKIPINPSSWNASETTIFGNSSYVFRSIDTTIVNGIGTPSPPCLFTITGVNNNKSSDTGLLGALWLGLGTNAASFLMSFLQTTYNTISSLVTDLNSNPVADGIDAAIATFTVYQEWLPTLQNIPITGAPASVNLSWEEGSSFSISDIEFQFEDNLTDNFTVSQFTVNADGSSSGGAIS